MQVFLPLMGYYQTAKVLDSRRLNKQIVEAYQIISDTSPTKNHPAILTWKDSKATLARYTSLLCREYTNRFNKTHMVETYLRENWEDFTDSYLHEALINNTDLNKLMRCSHVINLHHKDPDHYDALYLDLKVTILNIDKNHNPIIYIINNQEYRYTKLLDLIKNAPDGYYWPVCKSGGKAYQDTENWKSWWSEIKSLRSIKNTKSS